MDTHKDETEEEETHSEPDEEEEEEMDEEDMDEESEQESDEDESENDDSRRKSKRKSSDTKGKSTKELEQAAFNRALRIKMGKSGAQAASRRSIKQGKDACQRKLWNQDVSSSKFYNCYCIGGRRHCQPGKEIRYQALDLYRTDA